MTGFEIFMVVTAIASALAGGYSAVASGNAQRAAAEAAAEQEAENAKIAQQQANAAVDQGEAQKDAVRLKLAQIRAQGRTGYAASNVVLGSGSAANYEEDIEYRADLDIGQIDANTAMDVWGLRTQGVNYTNQASLLQAQGANAQTAGYGQGASSLLAGASQVAGVYSKSKGGSGSWTNASLTNSSTSGNSGYGR